MTGHEPLTRNEELVLTALRRQGGPRSAYQLLEGLRDEGLRGPPQIYRALKALGSRGLVHRLDSRNAFLACSHRHAHGHGAEAVIFLVCENCERVEEVCDEASAEGLAALGRSRGFVPIQSSVEIHGRCPACSTQGSGPA